jgi:beta-lactamase regulating signal transducer with metallopeptidase domain
MMTEWAELTMPWLVQTLAVGGSLLLLATFLIAAARQPARRRMIGSIAVRIALLVPLFVLSPKWLRIPVQGAPRQIETVVAQPTRPPQHADSPSQILIAPSATANSDRGTHFTFIIPDQRESVPSTIQAPANISVATRPDQIEHEAITPAQTNVLALSWRQWVIAGYAAFAGLFVIRWLFAQAALYRLIRRSRPASPALAKVLESFAGSIYRLPLLRIVTDLPAPVCCGLRRPVILLPQRLAEASDEEALRWVFAHELAHLARGDAWTAFWFGLAAALYFPLPWFWRLKKQVSLAQEHVADAEAAALSQPEEYAAFLVNLSRMSRPARQMAGVSGVLGSPSELYRRITMLLDKTRRVESSCPRRWSLVATGSFLSLAIVLSGLGLTRAVATARTQDDPAPKAKDQPKDDKQNKDGEEKFVRPPRAGAAAGQPQIPQFQFNNMNPEELQKQVQKMIEDMQKQFGQGGFGGAMAFPNFGQNPFATRSNGSGRLGVSIEKPSAVVVDQLDLPKDQGLVLNEVKADSAAAKAGLKANDIILEFAGKPVVSDPQEFRKMVSEVSANKSVDAVVLRRGRRETIKGLTLPEAKPEAENHFGGFPGGAGGFAMPNVQVFPQGLAPFRGFNNGNGNGGGFGGGFGHGTSISISNENFSINSHDDQMTIAVTGKFEDGKTKIESVKITDGTDKVEADSLEHVPTKYREKVQNLLNNIHVGK